VGKAVDRSIRFAEMAVIWVDMERGLYRMPDGTIPRHRDGTFRVVKAQIMRDVGLTTNYHDQKNRIWENPQFLSALDKERLRRDHGISTALERIEKNTGPVTLIADKIVDTIKRRLDDDEEELTTKELLQYGPAWIKLGLELEGKGESERQAGIEAILAEQAQTNRLNAEMVKDAVGLLQKFRAQQDATLAAAGIIDGEAEELAG
jgi:hypothetical protein